MATRIAAPNIVVLLEWLRQDIVNLTKGEDERQQHDAAWHISLLLGEFGALQWRPIETAPKDGSEVLLGFFPNADMEFYRWNPLLALANEDQPYLGWCDRCSDPPHEPPTHYLVVSPPQV